jgi:hypothetical protein
MVLRLIRDLPGDRAFLPPSPARRVKRLSANLAPASGRQNHTISPSAIASFVRAMIAPELSRPSHPASYVRDDRETPLMWERDGDGYKFDLGSSRSDLFSRDGLDRFSRKPRDLPVVQSHNTSHGKILDGVCQFFRADDSLESAIPQRSNSAAPQDDAMWPSGDTHRRSKLSL